VEESESSRGAETVAQAAKPISQRLPEISRYAKLNMGALSPGEIQMLQRTIGNQAVMRIVAGTRNSAKVQRDDDASATATPAASDSRPLTPSERSVAEFVFGKALNVDPIVIKESAAMAVGGYVRTLPDTIYVASGTKDTISTDLLVHELTHCAQYQHGVSRVVTAAYAIQAHYDYGGEQGLRDAIAAKKCFDHFNTEQQADIVRDYYLQVLSGASTYPWSVFVDQVRAQGACIWPSQPTPSPDQPPSTPPGSASA
jgi:hypothetical protein